MIIYLNNDVVEKKDAEELLQLKVNKKLLQQHISESTRL